MITPLYRLAAQFFTNAGQSSQPIDSAAARALDRQRRAVLSSTFSVLAKATSVGASLVSVPLTLKYLGAERFGMWMTISSMIGMFGFADLGIGNGLLSAISEANGKDDIAAMKRYISSAAVILSGIAALVLLAACILSATVPWHRFFNVHTEQAAVEAGPTVLVCMACFAFNIPASIVLRVQMGLQMGFLANIWQVIGSLLALVAVLSSVKAHLGLHALVLALMGTPILATALNAVFFFYRIRPELAPNFMLASKDDARKVMRIGLLFLSLQLAVALAFYSDNLVISRLLDATAVATYAVPEKMFSFISIGAYMLMVPLWPAYGEAIARGDHAWVRSTLKKSLRISILASTAGAVFLLIAGRFLLKIWIGSDVNPPITLLLGLALLKILDSTGQALAAFLNGAQVVGTQVVLSLSMSAFAILFKIAFIKHMGVSGTAYGTACAYFLFVIVPYAFLLPGLLSRIAPRTEAR